MAAAGPRAQTPLVRPGLRPAARKPRRSRHRPPHRPAARREPERCRTRYTPNPLARRPITLSARLNAATDATGRTDPRSAQAALGVRYELLPALSLTAERLIAVGDDARDDWLLRLSGGTSQRLRLLGRPLALDAYGEASLLGNGDSLAAGQARALAPLLSSRNLSLSAGLGSWASLQNTGPATIGRLDVGPSAAVRLGQGRLALELSADYRQRIAGEALPGSGPALTLGTSF